jgi:hypothetical protein
MASGRKLLEDESWAAAQAEFEAAYAAAPRAAPLIQIAACQQGAQRWPQAIATLERALRDHGGTLDEAEKKAAEQALAEMRTQVGTVQVVIAPGQATLRIDGEDQPPAGPQRVIVLGPGPHRLEARLEGWAPAAQTITIAGGDEQAVKLGLAPSQGKVTVHAPTGARGIAVDESAVGEDTWSGWLAPGAHVIHVYKPGGAAWSMSIAVQAGHSLEVSPAQEGTPSAPFEPARRAVRGPYGILAFTPFVPLPPTDFTGTAVGFSGGVRLGYRFASVVGGELVLEVAHASAGGQATPSFADTAAVPMSYGLTSLRAGLALRLTTTGQRLRFVQVLGGGVMVDTITWTPGTGAGTVTRQGGKGADGFGLSETGLEVELSRFLLGLTVQQLLGSRGGLGHATHDDFSADTFAGPQYSIGLGLRAGYGLW